MKNIDEEPSDIYRTKANETSSFEIPGFRLVGELGRGSFGVVYRAHDEALDRPVAIKVALVDEPERRIEYLQEAQKAAKLNVDGVVPVYQVGRLPSGMPFVVQMLLEGGTLKQELKRNGGIAPRRICQIMIRVAKTVAQAHAAGMIHRDLKPDNILLDGNGQPWIGDFGLALTEADQQRHKGEKAGTPLYMSPEQIQGRTEWLDGRTDIYALGIIFYELLVGRTPYAAQTRRELEEEILYRDPKPLSQYLTGIPNEFDQIFRKCCAKQTNDRYANAMELVHDLELADQTIDYTGIQFLGSARQDRFMGSTRGADRSTQRDTYRPTERGLAESTYRQPANWLIAKIILAAAVLMAVVAGGVMYSRNLRPANSGPGKKDEFKRPDKLVVSITGDSELKSISQALKLARPGETIFIQNGNYEEVLVIDKDVTLVGQGKPAYIFASSGTTVSVQGTARLTLDNLLLDNLGNSNNTIDVQPGASLSILNCKLFASSFNCVHAEKSPLVVLKKCVLRNGANEAIYVDSVPALQIDDCKFEITPGGSIGVKRIPFGVQAIRSAGHISDSTFEERGQRGIFWMDASGPVLLENNKFSSCDFPIELDNVADAKIIGKTEMVECINGIILKQSNVTIAGLHIVGTNKNLSNGIRIVHSTTIPPQERQFKIRVEDTKIESFDQGLHIADASVALKAAKVNFTSNHLGLNLDMARSASLEECTITGQNKGSIGIELGDCSMQLEDCELNGLDFGITQKNSFDDRRGLQCVGTKFARIICGLDLESGWAQLKDCQMQELKTVAIFSTSASDGQAKRKLELTSLTLIDCLKGLNAAAPGDVLSTKTELKIEVAKGFEAVNTNGIVSIRPKQTAKQTSK